MRRLIASSARPSGCRACHNVTLHTRYNACLRFHTSASSTRQVDGRTRTSQQWIPAENQAHRASDIHDTLVRAGFVKQTIPGIFHMMPLGLRVQEKIEAIIDYEMRKIAKICGTSLGDGKKAIARLVLYRYHIRRRSMTEQLTFEAKLFKLRDRNNKQQYLLSPTHEEEITTLVGSYVNTYRDLPLRTYQISRKYRDELRPRGGLLRGREFIMKDLYTFDNSAEEALETYKAVQDAYINIFNTIGIPYYIAAADSGNIGGDLSHEFHYASPEGEDTVIHCEKCNYTANQEVVTSVVTKELEDARKIIDISITKMISTDGKTLIQVIYPQNRILNISAILEAASRKDVTVDTKLDATSVLTVTDKCIQTIALQDYRVKQSTIVLDEGQGVEDQLNLCKMEIGDSCPECGEPGVNIINTIELGHTFYLGTKYSDALDAKVMARDSKGGTKVPIQMGCYGIGVTRLIAAAANSLKDEKGLAWPIKIAPWKSVILTSQKTPEQTEQVYDKLIELEGYRDEVIIDDSSKNWKAKFEIAQKVGYRVIISPSETESGTKVALYGRRSGETMQKVDLEDIQAAALDMLKKEWLVDYPSGDYKRISENQRTPIHRAAAVKEEEILKKWIQYKTK